MKNNEMITIQMTVEEAKQFGDAIQEVLVLLNDAAAAVAELFDTILPVIVEIENKDKAERQGESEEEEMPGSSCEDCTLPCLGNPNYMKEEKAAIPDDDSEEVKKKRKEFLRAYEKQLLKDLKDLALRL